MEPRHVYFAEALRANISLARLLGLSNSEIVIVAEAETRKVREEIARDPNHFDPEKDGA